MIKYLPAVALLASGCHAGPAAAQAGSAYNFQYSTATYAVPAELQELSGQAWVSDQQVACIEDETGDLFCYNLRTQRLDSTVSFAGPGDYENVGPSLPMATCSCRVRPAASTARAACAALRSTANS